MWCNKLPNAPTGWWPRVLSDEAVFGVTGQVPGSSRPTSDSKIVGAMRQVSDATIFDPDGPLKARSSDVVYARTDVGVGAVPIDRWLKPRTTAQPADAMGQTARSYVPTGCWATCQGRGTCSTSAT